MPSDASMTLLEYMAADNSASPSMPELMAKLGESDPRMALVGQILARRQAEQDTSSDDEPGPISDNGKHESVRTLRQLVSDMYQELVDLRARNGDFATALGACSLCWGEDSACAECAGHGGPGFWAPDRRSFVRLVAPAARSLQSRKSATADSPTDPSRNG